MTTVKSTYAGSLHVQSTHVASGVSLETDAPLITMEKENLFLLPIFLLLL
jgi:hypothetical protein